MSFFIYGILQWQPSFLIRSYGLSSAQLGVWLAISCGSGSFLGTLAGGVWASRYAAHQESRQLKMIGIALVGCSVFSAIIYLSSSRYLTLVLMGGVLFTVTASNGPVTAAIQTLVPERMRAVAVAVMLLFANLVGMGLGPLAAGVLSDALRPWAGNDSLRYALLALTPGFLWAGRHAWLASHSVERDLAIQSTSDEEAPLAPASDLAR